MITLLVLVVTALLVDDPADFLIVAGLWLPFVFAVFRGIV